jgi:hypothetical protein
MKLGRLLVSTLRPVGERRTYGSPVVANALQRLRVDEVLRSCSGALVGDQVIERDHLEGDVVDDAWEVAGLEVREGERRREAAVAVDGLRRDGRPARSPPKDE